MDFKLTEQERVRLLHHQERERRKKVAASIRRYQAITILLMLDAGIGFEQVAAAFGIHDSTVRRYLKRFEADRSIENYLSVLYKGSTRTITEEQCSELVEALKTQTFRTAAEVRSFISRRFGIRYSLRHTRRLLKELGFVRKKTCSLPAEADPEKQREFLSKTLEPLLERTREAGEPLYFCDATHPEYNTRPGYAWIPRGQRRVVKTVAGKRRVNLNGACNAHSPCDIIVIESDRINTESTIELFKRLQKRHPSGTIHVVCDNASYYHSKRLQEWLSTSRIKVTPLPKCSPNLNLIERLWKFMHEEVLDLHYYDSIDDFRSAIKQFFKYTGDHAAKLKSLLAPNFHIEGFAN